MIVDINRYNIYNTDEQDLPIKGDIIRKGVNFNNDIANEYQDSMLSILKTMYLTLSPNIMTSDYKILALNVSYIRNYLGYPPMPKGEEVVICDVVGLNDISYNSKNWFAIKREVIDNRIIYTAVPTFTRSDSNDYYLVFTSDIIVVDNIYDHIVNLNKSTLTSINTFSDFVQSGFTKYDTGFIKSASAELSTNFKNDIVEGLIDSNIKDMYVSKTYNDIGLYGGYTINYENVSLLEEQWVKISSTNEVVIPKYTNSFDISILNGSKLYVGVDEATSYIGQGVWIGADNFIDNTYIFTKGFIKKGIDYNDETSSDNIYNNTDIINGNIPDSVVSSIKMGDILIKLPKGLLSIMDINQDSVEKSFGKEKFPSLYLFINHYLSTNEYIDLDNVITYISDSEVVNPKKYDVIKKDSIKYIYTSNTTTILDQYLLSINKTNSGYEPESTVDFDKTLRYSMIYINGEEVIPGVYNNLKKGDKISIIGATQSLTVDFPKYDNNYIDNVIGRKSYDTGSFPTYEEINLTGSFSLWNTTDQTVDIKNIYKGQSQSLNPVKTYSVSDVSSGYIRLLFKGDDKGFSKTINFIL